MLKHYIEKYVNNMSIEDVYNFSKKNGIELTEKEASIILDYSKNRWEEILFFNQYVVLDEIKNLLRPEVYQKLDELIVFYKEKYIAHLKNKNWL